MPQPRRISLIQRPTPLHRLDRLSGRLGIDLWIKRDDLTGFALGGNKGRKLEFLMADALERDAHIVVTCGALQSNFIRQLGAACSICGMRCAAAVMNLPYDAQVGKPRVGTVPDANGLSTERLKGESGNVLLDRLFGVELHSVPDDDWSVLYDYAEELAKRYESEGLSVYRVPVGGSSGLGGYAFYEAAFELSEEFEFVVTATSSGSTQAGLGYALKSGKTKLIGVSADPEPDLIEDVLRVGAELALLLGCEPLDATSFDVRTGYAGQAYGVPSVEGNAAIELMAKTEGILLDPIYSGKAFAGLLDLVRSREIRGKVLFWHTGGVPTLFAMG